MNEPKLEDYPLSYELSKKIPKWVIVDCYIPRTSMSNDDKCINPHYANLELCKCEFHQYGYHLWSYIGWITEQSTSMEWTGIYNKSSHMCIIPGISHRGTIYKTEYKEKGIEFLWDFKPVAIEYAVNSYNEHLKDDVYYEWNPPHMSYRMWKYLVDNNIVNIDPNTHKLLLKPIEEYDFDFILTNNEFGAPSKEEMKNTFEKFEDWYRSGKMFKIEKGMITHAHIDELKDYLNKRKIYEQWQRVQEEQTKLEELLND